MIEEIEQSSTVDEMEDLTSLMRSMSSVVSSIIWNTFGTECFSTDDFADNCEDNTKKRTKERTKSGIRLPTLDTMVENGYIVREGNEFRLSDEEVRRLRT